MKRNIFNGMLLIGALALGSCSTTKLASNQLDKDDDVYYSNAKAGDQPEYVSRVSQNPYNDNQYNDNYNNNDDDYYYYDSYASRINRFGYLSPFNYYDDMYYGYSPFYNPYGYNPYYSGIGVGIGFGYGYGYSPYYAPYYGYGYGYNPYAYSYWGTGYGGGYPYWGVYSAYGAYGANAGTARPYRAQRPDLVNGSTRPASRSIGYNGNYPTTYMGRPMRTNSSGNNNTVRTNSTSGRSQGNEGYSRPQRPTQVDQPRPTYQPPTVERSSPPPSSGGGSEGGGRSSGGGRPARP